MDLFSILTLIGGLALFLYGMNAMGDGLAKVSGGKLEKILENLTSNPIKAVLLGAGVTAVIQSSSATTVMVVGFVNSGIMKLSQAVGVIMGANIGTTITSWILSLTGIQSDNFIIQMFKPIQWTDQYRCRRLPSCATHPRGKTGRKYMAGLLRKYLFRCPRSPPE